MMKRKNSPTSLIYAFALIALISTMLPVLAYAEAMEDRPIVKIQALDKSTARTVTFQAKVGSTIQYGSLFIKTQACRESPPLDKPESAAFLQIWEVPVGKEKSEWIFSGWMFASSPALSAMDHPVYDVWVLDCIGGEQEEATENDEAKMSKTKKQTAEQSDLEPVENDSEENVAPVDAADEDKLEAMEEEPMAEDDPLDSLLDTMTQE